MNTVKLLILATALALVTLPATSAIVPVGPSKSYVGAGTIVTNFNLAATPGTAGQITIADNGAVTCEDTNRDGIYESGTGGACITFAEFGTKGNGIYVRDASVADKDLAFQVCLDANGDGLCGNPAGSVTSGSTDYCQDRIFFSHSTRDGSNANPLGLNRAYFDYIWGPAGLNCGANGGFPGFVVILCAGVHGGASLAQHTHHVTRGTITPISDAPQMSDAGDFCGGPVAAKAYQLV
ncbi:MAG TPA: hypothetical protein VNZ52_09155 [Candidatus Thermoplasmatota archaeon]|nr:hypothetical protein [Candidatus Thermoplasmatota archaeon]